MLGFTQSPEINFRHVEYQGKRIQSPVITARQDVRFMLGFTQNLTRLGKVNTQSQREDYRSCSHMSGVGVPGYLGLGFTHNLEPQSVGIITYRSTHLRPCGCQF